jgi:hypothetical protein
MRKHRRPGPPVNIVQVSVISPARSAGRIREKAAAVSPSLLDQAALDLLLTAQLPGEEFRGVVAERTAGCGMRGMIVLLVAIPMPPAVAAAALVGITMGGGTTAMPIAVLAARIRLPLLGGVGRYDLRGDFRERGAGFQSLMPMRHRGRMRDRRHDRLFGDGGFVLGVSIL